MKEIKCENRDLYTFEEVMKLRKRQKKIIESFGIDRIDELTLKDLKQGAEQKVIDRARDHNLATQYQGVTRGGIVEYETTARTTKGKKTWKQEVKLLDLSEAIEASKMDNMSEQDIVNLAVFGDIAVHCNCPAFLYFGYQYMAWQMDYGIYKQNQKPDKRNPDRSGTVCKHLYNVFTVMPMHISRIAKDLKNQGLL